MRWARGLLPLLALGAVMVSCTGTTENIPPLLLAVGRVDATSGVPQMVLVEDNFASNLSVPRTLSVVAGSARNLTYPAVASDLVDRAGTRSKLVVLTRDLSVAAGPAPAPASNLLTFNLVGIDPVAPAAFTQDASLQLTGSSSAVFPTGSSGSPWCFSGVSVSRTGRYVTLLDDPAACGDTSGRYPRLFQVDTAASPATVTQVAPAAGSQPVQATVPFDDQAATNDTLYFLVSGVLDALLYADPVPHATDTAPSSSVATMARQDQIVLLGNGSRILAVTNQAPYSSPPTTTTSYLEVADPSAGGKIPAVQTVGGARALAVDPQGITEQAVVAGATSLAVHSNPSDAAPAETPAAYDLTGVAATIDPINQFAYVVDDNRITVLDLLTVKTGTTNWYTWFSPSLTLPINAGTNQEITTVEWARAAP